MATIIKRELLDHLQSIQFNVLLGVTIILFAANGLIFSKRCNQQMTWYSQNVTTAQQHPSTQSTELYVRPGSLIFVSEGGDKYSPSAYKLEPKGELTPLPNEPRNYKMPEFPELDWSFIIKILFSLYVLLLGYDTISGEKELGTLRQVLSQPLGRFKLLIAKYTAIMLTAMVPLIIGILISLVIVGISIPSIFTIGNLARIVMEFFLALMYLSIFAFLGLLVSSLIHQSSLVLLTLLVVWALFAVILPNVSGILAEKFTTVASEYDTAKQLGPLIQQQVWAKIGKIGKRVDSGELKTEEEVKRETDQAFNEGQEDLTRHYDSYYHIMKQRTALAHDLSRLSPTALFQYASENLAETGVNREERFVTDAKEYSTTYDQYILKKVGKLVAVSPWSFGTNMTINGKPTMISSPRPEEYNGDKSDFPRFSENPSPISKSIHDAMVDIVGLILWNFVLAVFAFRAILRTDVR